MCGVTLSTCFDAEEGCVILEVEDEGSGIPAEHLPRLTEPFFTTNTTAVGPASVWPSPPRWCARMGVTSGLRPNPAPARGRG